jgi:hypothetical protein
MPLAPSPKWRGGGGEVIQVFGAFIQKFIPFIQSSDQFVKNTVLFNIFRSITCN